MGYSAPVEVIPMSSEFPACAFGGNSKRRTKVLTSLAAISRNPRRNAGGPLLLPSMRLRRGIYPRILRRGGQCMRGRLEKTSWRNPKGPHDGQPPGGILRASAKEILTSSRGGGGPAPWCNGPIVPPHRNVLQLRTTKKEATHLKGLCLLDTPYKCHGVQLPPGANVIQINSLSGGIAGSGDKVPDKST